MSVRIGRKHTVKAKQDLEVMCFPKLLENLWLWVLLVKQEEDVVVKCK